MHKTPLPIPRFLRRAHGQKVLTRREMTSMAKFLLLPPESAQALLPQVEPGLRKLQLLHAPSPSNLLH